MLPENQRQILQEIVTAGRANRAAKTAESTGIRVLLIGLGAIDKMMAVEFLTGELGADLLRVDLGAIVSKFIGETEKNLARVFEAAEASHSILFFDEADALFGKRNEVKDSHDRFANIEVNYLLASIEEYKGIVILATSHKENIDEAFLRRCRLVGDLC